MCGPRRVEQAASVGLTSFAITDHNAISAIPSARLVADYWGVEVIAGAELDCDFHNTCAHIIGLFLDLDDRDFQTDMLALQQAWREWIRETMVGIGRAAGVALAWDDLYFWGDVPTRGDVHDALRQKGYEGPIERGGGVPYGPPGARYVPMPLSAEYVCDMIHRAGGAAILGHPWLNFAPGTFTEPAEFRHILAMGIDGWECWRGDYQPEWTDYLLTWARRLDILPAGGSDSHGPRPGRTLYPFGGVTVPDEAVEAIRDKAAEYR
jgi:predicted metal-dependent phosphoesterase TrpH